MIGFPYALVERECGGLCETFPQEAFLGLRADNMMIIDREQAFHGIMV